jgi:hypothetical protein
VYWVIAMPLKRDEFFVLQDACMMVVHEELNNNPEAYAVAAVRVQRAAGEPAKLTCVLCRTSVAGQHSWQRHVKSHKGLHPIPIEYVVVRKLS